MPTAHFFTFSFCWLKDRICSTFFKDFSPHQNPAHTSNESFIKHSILLREFLSLEMSFSKRCSVVFSRLGRCRSQRQSIADLEREIFFLSVRNKQNFKCRWVSEKKIKISKCNNKSKSDFFFLFIMVTIAVNVYNIKWIYLPSNLIWPKGKKKFSRRTNKYIVIT